MQSVPVQPADIDNTSHAQSPATGDTFAPVTELRVFRRACYDAARRTGGNLIEFRLADGVTPNFHIDYWKPVTLGEALFNYWD